MALSATVKITALTLATLFLFSSAVAHKFSIVGYAPEDLGSIGKLIELFETWVAKHSKVYHSIEEKLERFEVFKDNLKHIDERNKESTEYWLGLNEFADLSHDEFRSKYLGLKVDQYSNRAALSGEFSYKDVVDVPKDVDWRKKGAVTPVKNQGYCNYYCVVEFPGRAPSIHVGLCIRQGVYVCVLIDEM